MGYDMRQLTLSPLSGRHSKCLFMTVNNKNAVLCRNAPRGRSCGSFPGTVFSDAIMYSRKSLTKRHLNFIRDALDAHQCKSNYSNNGNCAPAKIVNEGERQSKQV